MIKETARLSSRAVFAVRTDKKYYIIADSIVSVDYTLDDDRNPAKAMVSIKHRLNETEGDSFSYLTMELVFRDGSWQMNWSGIEK